MIEKLGECGCPMIGTFEPKLGDLGIDFYGHHWFWDGKQWHDENGNPAKTLGEWLGFNDAEIP